MEMRLNENGLILCNRYVFRNERNENITLLGKPLECEEDGFVYFLAGSGRKYLIRKELILEISETDTVFELRGGRK